MSHDDDEDDHSTIFLKAPVVADQHTDKTERMSSTGKLICLDANFLESQPEGDEFWLTHSEQIVGRGSECPVRIDSTDLSRAHARISAFSDKWVIEDCGSRNGIAVNGSRIKSPTLISSGDNIHLGRVPFRFEVVDVAPAELAEITPTAEQPTIEQDTMMLDLPDADAAALAQLAGIEPEGDALTPEPGTASQRKKVIALASIFGVPVDEATESQLAEAIARLRKDLPQIVVSLAERARSGDVEASRACLDYLVLEGQRLPATVELSGSIQNRVKQTLNAMAERDITPRQALDILQSYATARDLLKKPPA